MTTVDSATDDSTVRDRIIETATKHDLHYLVYYGSEPWVALVDRNDPPQTSHARPNERIAVVDWIADDQFGVSITEADDQAMNPDWETPGEPDAFFDDHDAAVKYAVERLH